MKYGAIAAFGVMALLVTTMMSISINQTYAGGYEKSQAVSQANECGNYWFPVNIICSNLNSQAQGNDNDVAIAATTTPDSNPNYGAPFP
jgi:hypothetical protein